MRNLLNFISKPFKVFGFKKNLLNLLWKPGSVLGLRKNFKIIPTPEIRNVLKFPAIPSMFTVYHFFQPNKNKANQYWKTNNIFELLDESDVLYEDEKYLEVYEILNRIQFHNNVEVQWRICRTLYKMSRDPGYSESVKENMIMEAYALITRALTIDANHSELHKWMAVILDAKTGYDSTVARVESSMQVKEHMLKSIELNSDDPSVYYMLGFWCYEMTKMSWLQRLIAKVLFREPPTSSYEEAYNFFLKAEQIRPRFFIGNIHMLGKCCYELGMMYKARYYLQMAADLPAYNELEKQHSEDAKKLAEKLKQYDITTFDPLK